MKIDIELLTGYQQAVTPLPIAIQQVLIAMRTEIMTILPELSDGCCEDWFPVKAACEEERSFNAFLLQGVGNNTTAIAKFVARKNKRQLFIGYISTGNSPVLRIGMLQ